MVQASTMKWMDLSLNASGCHWGVYARDGNFLRSFPRLTDHLVMSAANRSPPFPIHPRACELTYLESPVFCIHSGPPADFPAPRSGRDTKP